MNTQRTLGISLLLMLSAAAGCATVEGTGRQQLMLISEGQEMALGADAYREIVAKENLSNDQRMIGIVRRVGKRIAAQVNRPSFAWEFTLIESKQINAFCLPGGKIAVYTGILPIMQNEAGMAAVMGHEVAHAVARHSGERMSQHLGLAVVRGALQKGLERSSKATHDTTMAVFGLGSQFGVLLPYSRSHELEADHLGILYAARAGYDPREAVALWERMEAAGGDKPPEFLSTHPKERRRIRKLGTLMPEAMGLYNQARKRYGFGETW